MLQAGPRVDDLFGGEGPDTLNLGDGEDQGFGGAGNDLLISFGDDDEDLVNCGTGTDEARISANDVVQNTQGEETIGSAIIVTTGTGCETIIVDGVRIPTV